MSLLFNMLSRFTGHSFTSKEQVSFNFKAAVTSCSNFGTQENKVCHCFHCFPIYLLWGDGTRCYDLSFWMLSFKPTFPLSSFTFIKRFFSSSSLSGIRLVSSAYLRLDISPCNLDCDCVYCDAHSQRLWHSQQSRNRCFSGTLLLFRWSSGCWQFDLWFLCLF